MENPCTTEKARRDYVLLRKALDQNDQKAYAELMSLYRDSIAPDSAFCDEGGSGSGDQYEHISGCNLPFCYLRKGL